MKLGMSLFWRVMVIHLLFVVLLLVFFSNLANTTNQQDMYMKPTIIFGALAVIFFAFTFVLKNGLVHVLFGARLNKSAAFWKRFTLLLSAVYLLLSLCNLAVAQMASLDLWIQYKTFVPLAILLSFCLIVSVRLGRYNSSFDTDAPRQST